MLTGPILPTLLRLALPNMLAMAAAAAVGIAETAYVGALGMEPLAAMAVVFPFVMLVQMFSSGAMGGGISSAIARAYGACDAERAAALATHALWIGIGAGVLTALAMWSVGPALYRLLGAEGEVLRQARIYSTVVFAGAIPVWIANSLISVLRGTGDMRWPSVVMLAVCALQIVIGAGLGLGLGPLPRWGMAGVAAGQGVAFALGAVVLLMRLTGGRARLRLALRGVPLQRRLLWDILRVGAVACLSPLQSVLTVLVLTGLVARVGVEALAGYGIGARLEFLLIPIAFGVGVAAVPMVGSAIGARDVARARRVGWTAGAVSAVLLGAIGLVVALWPDLWAALFTDKPAVLDAARRYLRNAGPAFAFFGLGLTLYFSSQGAGKVGGPVLAATLRLLVVAGAGGWLVSRGAADADALFRLVAVAMVVYGLATAAAVRFTPWSGASAPARAATAGPR